MRQMGKVAEEEEENSEKDVRNKRQRMDLRKG